MIPDDHQSTGLPTGKKTESEIREKLVRLSPRKDGKLTGKNLDH